ncbi:hypothetical protein ACHQM5_021110 [Ranunculus cassubicifolius]
MIQDCNNNFWMMGKSTSSSSSSSSSPWSRAQDKLFEQALVIFPEETSDRWERIAMEVPGKKGWEIRKHYDELVRDISEIESGRVELPCYADDSFEMMNVEEGHGKSQISFKLKSQGESERKKGTPWTEEEHKLFLIGLQKYGKGDWRSISRNTVVSRTPTQVASHAQKYYLRLNSGKKEKRRSSIHDITTVEEDPLSQPNNQTQIPQYQNPVWQNIEPRRSFHSLEGSSVYQQQFGFPI